MYKSNTSNYPWGCPKFSKTLLHLDSSPTVLIPSMCWQIWHLKRDTVYVFMRMFRLGSRQGSILLYIQKSQFQDNMVSCCRTEAPSYSTQGGAVQAGEAQFNLAKHWCHVVPLSWMALISALSWGRLIPTVLTLSPVLHCDTGHRRNSPHPL